MALCLVVAGSLGMSAQAADDVERDADSIAALQKMSTYLKTLKAYQVIAKTTNEDVFEDGQKIQYTGTVNFLVNMPGQLRIDSRDDRHDRLYLFDGKNFTLFARGANLYASVPAPSSVGELATIADEKYGIELPMVDFFRWGSSSWKPADITAAMDLGPSVVDGITCQQYAFRQAGVDWQIWIQKGDYPLPRRLVITTTTDEARPQHTAQYLWNLAPSFNDAAFQMDPTSDAQRVLLQGMDPSAISATVKSAKK